MMKFMASWMTVGNMEGANTKSNWKGRDGRSLVEKFTYWQTFGLIFLCFRQVDDHKKYVTISYLTIEDMGNQVLDRL